MPIDCGFTRENHWFGYKACAIIARDGCVLFAGNSTADYFYPVGGAVQIGETAESAVVREVYEETGVKYEIDRLTVIHENFFKEDSELLKGLDCHEISFYFLMKPEGYSGAAPMAELRKLCIGYLLRIRENTGRTQAFLRII